jgi:hypothetical protein
MHTIKKADRPWPNAGRPRVDPGATDGRTTSVNVSRKWHRLRYPLPRIYVLDAEHNINAFAADSIFRCGRGAPAARRKLNRDNCRASSPRIRHILNGDARATRSSRILFGVMFMGIVGR